MSDTLATHRSWWIGRNGSDARRLESCYPRVQEDIHTRVAIIGGGITGLSTALELLERGYDVAVFESAVIGCGTTGGSTGHLDAHPEGGPSSLSRVLELNKARQAVALRLDAIDAVERRVNGDCEFQRLPAYFYSENPDDANSLREQGELASRMGLNVDQLATVPYPNAACGYRIDDMARIDSLAYVKHLARMVSDRGGRIFENSLVAGPVETRPESLDVNGSKVHFEEVVVAVHCNDTDALYLYLETPPYQSYVLAARVSDPPPDALYWDNANPYFYTRRASTSDPKLLLIGGCDHRTGTDDPIEAERRLEEYAREHFAVEEIVCRWSAELFEPTDGLPMIGKVPGKENVWIATGFSGIGLTWGTAAGGLLARQINGESVPLEKDLSPSRFGVLGLATMAAEQMTTAVNLAERILPASTINPRGLKPGEGKVGMVDGVHAAICRDHAGCEHRLSPICTHMGGVVHWNAAARTWDCPVHGGRFTADGRRLYGPPESSLEAVSAKPMHVKNSEE